MIISYQQYVATFLKITVVRFIFVQLIKLYTFLVIKIDSFKYINLVYVEHP